MKLKTLKNITKEAIGDRDGRVEFEIIKDPLYPEALCATIKDLREEAKLWRDEIEKEQDNLYSYYTKIKENLRDASEEQKREGALGMAFAKSDEIDAKIEFINKFFNLEG